MGIRGELHSEKLIVAEGKRTYFFNVKQNRHGDSFLVIAENIFKFDDRVDRQQIVIYEEHLDDFRYALNKAVFALKKAQSDTSVSSDKKQNHKKYKVKQIPESPENKIQRNKE